MGDKINTMLDNQRQLPFTQYSVFQCRQLLDNSFHCQLLHTIIRNSFTTNRYFRYSYYLMLLHLKITVASDIIPE